MSKYKIAIYSLILAIIFFIPMYYMLDYHSQWKRLEIPIRWLYMPSLMMTVVTGGGHTAPAVLMLLWMWAQNFLIFKLVIMLRNKIRKKA